MPLVEHPNVGRGCAADAHFSRGRRPAERYPMQQQAEVVVLVEVDADAAAVGQV